MAVKRTGCVVCVCACVRACVRACIRYYLKGVNAGHTEVFVENLPCLPDNIRRSSSGGYWVACSSPRYDGKFNMHDFVAPRPWIRWIASKVSENVLPVDEICVVGFVVC